MKNKELIKWVHDFCERMNWDYIPLARIKISRMPSYRGLCICDGDEFYIVMSEVANRSNKEFFHTLVHEIIHAQLFMDEKTATIAHKHKKDFKRLAKQVEKKTFGKFSARKIVE